MLAAQQADAASAPAGTIIPNTAAVAFQRDGKDAQATSNMAGITVQEELGIGLDWAPSNALETTEATSVRVPFILTNRGNGREAFVLDGAIAGVDAAISGFQISGDDAGATGTVIAKGGQTIELAPGQALRLDVLVRAGAVGRGTLSVTAHALTGYGQPGTAFPQKGDGGCTAVVGATTAAAILSKPIAVTGGAGSNEPVVTLTKAQAVEAADGSANPTHGAQITYTLIARITGVGNALGAVVTDPIPEGTDYVPGSLTLDGSAIADGGNLDASGIAVPLGDVASGQTRTITFKVAIR